MSEGQVDTNDAQSALKDLPTILVVDDEELMRDVMAMMIEGQEGKCLVAADGPGAIAALGQHVQHVGLVVLDFSMPGMNGFQTYKELEKIAPNLRALFVSGLPITAEVSELCKSGVAEFLSKPFREEELVPALVRLAKKQK